MDDRLAAVQPDSSATSAMASSGTARHELGLVDQGGRLRERADARDRAAGSAHDGRVRDATAATASPRG